MTVALIEQHDDRALVEQHRAGDDEAFRQIVVRHHRSLYANALRRLGDPVLAEDAVQETFLRAFRGLDRFDGDYRLDAWLHRIVTNACHDIGRRRGRDTRLFDKACTEVELEAPPADDGLEVAPDARFGAALEQLPDSYREALILRFVEEMSYTDVAERAGISEENARARVSRGRSMLKKMMTGASGLVIWAIPPLRRAQMQVQDPDMATQAAQQVHNVTGITNAVSSVVAQAGPVIASTAPAVTSTGPVVKAAVAAGLAAAVAIPTGVAVDRAMEAPMAKSDTVLLEDAGAGAGAGSMEAADARPVTPSTAVAERITAQGSVEPVTSELRGPDSSVVPTAPSTAVPATTTTSTPSDASRTPTTSPTTTPPPEQPAPTPSATVRTEALGVTRAGPHDDLLTGPVTIQVGDDTISAELSGKFGVGPAGPKDPDAPREVDGTFTLTLDDGSSLELRLGGSATVSEVDGERVVQLTAVRFVLQGGADLELDLPEKGDVAGSVTTADDTGRLALTLTGTRS